MMTFDNTPTGRLLRTLSEGARTLSHVSGDPLATASIVHHIRTRVDAEASEILSHARATYGDDTVDAYIEHPPHV